jgi:hypothetical protein
MPLLLLPPKPIVSSGHPLYNMFKPLMAPVVRVKPNGPEDLLLHDEVSDDLKNQGWYMFIKMFHKYNLQVAKEFTLTFDGYRENGG